MNRAIGMVIAIEKMPHGLSASAFTTMSASTAMMIDMIASVATSAATPPTTPNSSLAIWPSERPRRRIEKNSTSQSCTAPAATAPTMIQIVPGRYPICAASTGPTRGPAPAIAAKWCPKSTRRSVGSKSRPLSSTSAGVARRSSGLRSLRSMNFE